jgi:hypothetical protein
MRARFDFEQGHEKRHTEFGRRCFAVRIAACTTGGQVDQTTIGGDAHY